MIFSESIIIYPHQIFLSPKLENYFDINHFAAFIGWKKSFFLSLSGGRDAVACSVSAPNRYL